MPYASTAAFGQAGITGSVGGHVADAQGHVVVRARVTLRSETQGTTFSTITDLHGEYLFSTVAVGSYTLTVTAPTFGAYTVAGINIDANQAQSISAVLSPGSTSTDVVVTADGTTVDTHSATVGFTIDRQLVENLPIDGNNVVQLAALLPGVTDVNAPTTFTNDNSGPTFNISGSRNNQNLLLLDGAVWNNLYNNTGINFPPSQALAEVSVLTNGFKAQYGRNVGSVFNVLTRSGSNKVRGEIYEIVQNKALNAADYITHQNPSLVSNQFGAGLGGPIPHTHAFFYASYQDLRLVGSVVAAGQTLSAAERGLTATGAPLPCLTAAYSGMSCASFRDDGGTIANPFSTYFQTSTNPAYVQNYTTAVSAVNAAWTVSGHTGASPCPALLGTVTSLPNNEIPSVCFNPVAVTLLKYQPLPNTPVAGSVLQNAITTAKQPRNDQNGLLRLDGTYGRHSLDVRYYETDTDDETANGVNSGNGVATYDIDHNRANIHFGGIGDTWVLNRNTLNVLRADYKRYKYTVTPNDNTTLAAAGAVYTQPQDNSLPNFSFNGRNLSFGIANNNNLSVDEGFELDDSLSWTHGRHNFQFGAEYLRLQYLNRFFSEPTIGFGSNYTSNVASDYMMGLVASAVVQNGTNQAAIQHDLYSYAQDDWRITSKLTLNLGVRYELPFMWYQPDGQASTFIPGYQSAVFPNSPANLAFVGDKSVERSLAGTTFHNIAPRFGFAYDVFGNGRTSIRGGIGLFYDAINALVVGLSAPYHYRNNLTQPTGGLSNLLLGQPAVPANYVKGRPAVFTAPYSITFPDANFTAPYTESLNFGIEQRITKTSNLQVLYVGHFTRHLGVGFDLNPAIFDCSGSYYQINPVKYCTSANTYATYQPNNQHLGGYYDRSVYPNFNNSGGVLDYITEGTANYNALQAIYTMRASRSLTTTISYTYSKSMDVGSNTGINSSFAGPTMAMNYAPSDFDTKDILNIGWVLRTPLLNRGYRAARAVLNGWSFNGIYNARTGHPFSPISSQDTTLRHVGTEYLSVNPLVGKYQPLPSNRHRIDKVQEWFNIADVVVPATCAACSQGGNTPVISYTFPLGAYGNIKRNSFRAPAFINTTLAVQRIFPLSHGTTFNFRIDAINAFNTPNLGTPGLYLSEGASKNTNFGGITNTVGNNGNVGTNGRRLQLTGTLRF